MGIVELLNRLFKSYLNSLKGLAFPERHSNEDVKGGVKGDHLGGAKGSH
jgi:hypothetical protein